MADGNYIPSGVAKVVWAPAATMASPTPAQITAGQVLTVPTATPAVEALKEMAGWETAANSAPIPNLATNFTASIPGRKSGSTATCTFYDDASGEGPIFAAFEEEDDGFMLIMPHGQSTGALVEVWPARVSTINRNPLKADDDPAQFVVSFEVTGPPNKTATVAAS